VTIGLTYLKEQVATVAGGGKFDVERANFLHGLAQKPLSEGFFESFDQRFEGIVAVADGVGSFLKV
jgi:hypothetical protein